MDRIKPFTETYSDMNPDVDDRLSAIQEFMHDQNHCCLCGSELSFSHKLDHFNLTIEEDARCGSCHISLRTKTHSLQ